MAIIVSHFKARSNLSTTEEAPAVERISLNPYWICITESRSSGVLPEAVHISSVDGLSLRLLHEKVAQWRCPCLFQKL